MSNQQGGPPRGPAPPVGGYGPGHTVLGSDAYPDPPPAARGAGAPIPPTTVRDAYTDHGGAAVYPAAPAAYPSRPTDHAPPPAGPAPYGAPGSAYGGGPYGGAPHGGADGGFDPMVSLAPVGVPPPPRGRGRGRKKAGPSLAVIGAISFVLIGSSVTVIALVSRPTGDEKPAPTVEVPAAPSPPPDPVASATPPDPPGAPTDQPTAPPPGPARRALPRPGQMRPGGRPGNIGPGPNGPNGPYGPYNPRGLPRRPR